MNPGDVLLSVRTGFAEFFIDWATVSKYSHCVLVGDGHLIEAEMRGVSRSPLDKYPPSTYDLVRPVATPEQVAKALAWAESKVGTGYGWRDVAYSGLRDVLHLPIGWRWRHWGHLDCSALVVGAYSAAGVELTYVPAPSPADVGFSTALVGPRYWDKLMVRAK